MSSTNREPALDLIQNNGAEPLGTWSGGAKVSRRALLGALSVAGALLASGYGASKCGALPTLFSDCATGTGQRRGWRLASGLSVLLDSRSALDSVDRAVTLQRGRVLLEVTQGAGVSLRTAQICILPGQAARLIVQQQAGVTLVQMLDGVASIACGSAAPVVLEGGWQQLFGDKGCTPRAALPDGAGAWTHGHLVAEHMPLAEVLEELDNYRPGVLRCDPRVAGLQVSRSLSLDQPDDSLTLLSEVLPVRVLRVLGFWVNVVPA
ncbi:FecR domain-containing protein [Pseudomonas sp. CCOS 191]|uniref:FecR domain-containing protein n=1 Tax=Pseudomonas sp. CCOS 191 TaxID=1649877 RepID=UPI0018E6D819|nr:FecR domain-containing protein [Pseudomonas sp. CCOS 191]MBI6954398.1 transcriptional regulator [Pseudomonas sp. CCOS 191]